MPNYKELSIKTVWPSVKDNDKVLKYMPPLVGDQLPEKDFLYRILSTLFEKETSQLVENACKNRSVADESKEEELVEIDSEIYQELESIANLKTTRGRSNHLLKKKATGMMKNRVEMAHQADFSFLKKDEILVEKPVTFEENSTKVSPFKRSQPCSPTDGEGGQMHMKF